jgi:hypothetical protein
MDEETASRIAQQLADEIRPAEDRLVLLTGNRPAGADIEHHTLVTVPFEPLLEELDADSPSGSGRRIRRYL